MISFRNRVRSAAGPLVCTVAFLCFATQGVTALWQSLFVPRLQWHSLIINLGELRSSDQPIARFPFKNVGTADLVIHQVRSSCPACLQVSKVPSGPVAAGGVSEIEVKLLAHKVQGAVSRSILVTTNDPRRPQVQLRIQAQVVPPGDPKAPSVPSPEN